MKHIFLLLIVFTSSPQYFAFENSTNICERCECESNETQFTLNCKDRNFGEILANWPQHNTTLIATFSNNSITTLEQLPESKYLERIVLSHCGIKNLDNGIFETVTNIVYIDLSYNLLTSEEVAPEKFKGPYNDTQYEPLPIKHLNLGYNQIHSLQHNLFEHMDSLVELNLEGNHFKVLDNPTREALSNLRQLEVLNLANNDLTELVEDAVKNMDSLKSLNLAENDLDFVPTVLASLGKTLEILVLDDNPILEIQEDDFMSLPALKELSLNKLIRVDYIRPNTFSIIKNLEILRMSNCELLKDIDDEAFANDQKLEQLILNNNSLTEIDISLVNWPNLKKFEINDNPLVCTCVLYNISKNLSNDLKRNKNGATCTYSESGISEQIFQIPENICKGSYNKKHISTIVRHFETMRITLIICGALLTAFALLAVVVAFLRYRRYKMNINYPFASRVMYNPLNISPTTS